MTREGPKPQSDSKFGELVRADYKSLLTLNLPSLSEVIAGLLAAATVVVVMGAMVLWLRAGASHVPQIQALAVMPRQEFLIVGAKALALPTVIWTVVQAIALPIGGAFGMRAGYRSAQRAAARGRKRDTEQIRSTIVYSCCGLALTWLLLYPFDYQTVVVVLIPVGLALTLKAGIHPKFPAMLGIAALIAFIMTFARELDSPDPLPRATVTTISGVKRSGSYVASTSDGVYLGIHQRLVEIPARHIRLLALSPAKQPSAAQPSSLGSHLLHAISSVIP